MGQGRYDCYPLKAVKPSSGEGYGELQTADSYLGWDLARLILCPSQLFPERLHVGYL